MRVKISKEAAPNQNRRTRKKWAKIMAKHFEKRIIENAVFKNCNVCGRGLIDPAEFEMGMCLICASE